MRCKICDWDIVNSFRSNFPDEDYCEICEAAILRTIREQEELEEIEDDLA